MKRNEGASFGMNRDQLVNKYGDSGAEQALMGRQRDMNMLGQRGIDPQLVSQLHAGYLGFNQKHGGTATLDQYFKEMSKGKGSEAKTLQQGLDALSKTMPERLASLDRNVEGIFNSVAGSNAFKGIVDGINNVFAPFGQWFQDVTQLLKQGDQLLKTITDPIVSTLTAISNFIKGLPKSLTDPLTSAFHNLTKQVKLPGFGQMADAAMNMLIPPAQAATVPRTAPLLNLADHRRQFQPLKSIYRLRHTISATASREAPWTR